MKRLGKMESAGEVVPSEIRHRRGILGRWPGWLCLWTVILAALGAQAVPAFDTTTPASFFTNVANEALLNETAGWEQNFTAYTNTFGVTNAFGVTNIPVWVNGRFVYASSVQRLLQVTANLYEAMSTNFYPAVYRPAFYRDPATGNIFIKGYTLITTVDFSSVNSDPSNPLNSPVDVSALVAGTAPQPLNSVNVYGVPWIIGARKGFPSFNEMYQLSTVQVSRRLQVIKPPLTSSGIATNQLYLMGITNQIGISFWNSYYSNYYGSSNITVYAADTMQVILTNPVSTYSGPVPTVTFTNLENLAVWPGSGWNPSVIPLSAALPNPASFVSVTFTNAFLPVSAYQWTTGTLMPVTNTSLPWQTNVVQNYQLPQFGLTTTNWMQAYILDGAPGSQHVIDFVQYSGFNTSRNVNAELADPNFPDQTGYYYQWSTNAFGKGNTSSSPQYGEVNQMLVSRGFIGANSPPGGQWSQITTPSGGNSIAEQQLFFNGFWNQGGAYSYLGLTYTNTLTACLAPYTPTRTLWDFVLWQANDPLVHYLSSDLNYLAPGQTGPQRSDVVPAILNVPNNSLNLNQLGLRFQPWGLIGQMMSLSQMGGVDTNAYEVTFKDPAVWRPDFWNFPTNQTWNPNWLGQVHRGTPWQTIYLKAPDLITQVTTNGGVLGHYGTNTWENWTGDLDPTDAPRTSPANDWHLAALLTALLNTNAPATFSVNTTDSGAWAAQFDGLEAITNSTPETSIILSSNSPAVAAIVSAIQSYRATQNGQVFADAGDVLAVPQLSTQSPFLSTTLPAPYNYLTDAEYEAIPSQLLSQLTIPSVGALTTGNGQLQLRFSGAAGHVYAVQSSPDMLHWTSFSTNSPAAGTMVIPLPAPPGAGAQFYRTLLVQ